MVLSFQAELQVAAVSPDTYEETFSHLKANVEYVTQNVNNAPLTEDVHLAVAADVLSNRSYITLKNLSASLKPNCFILLEETTAQLDLNTVLRETDLTLASRQIDSTGKNYLLLKKREKGEQPIVIRIAEKTFSWVEDMKAALNKSYSEGREILFVSQNEELLGKM